MIRIAAMSLLLALGCGSPRQTRLDQVHDLIQSPDYAAESVLWLRALGIPATEAACAGKLSQLLQQESEEPDGDCRYRIDGPFAEAVLVSRSQYERLPEIQGLLDTEALEAYVLWSERPERVGLERTPEGLRIDADLGPNDLVLARVAFSEGWSSDVPLSADPIGYTLIAPERPGRRIIEVHRAAPQPTPSLWGQSEIPRILPKGVAQPGQGYLVIYGERFMPGLSSAIVDDVELPGVYSSANQLNVQLPAETAPGLHQLRVKTPGAVSRPVEIEVLP